MPTNTPDPLTDEELAAMLALANAADDGPWVYEWIARCQISPHVKQVRSLDRTYTICTPVHSNEQTARNMQFVAAAREGVPCLIHALQAARAERDLYYERDVAARQRLATVEAERDEEIIRLRRELWNAGVRQVEQEQDCAIFEQDWETEIAEHEDYAEDLRTQLTAAHRKIGVLRAALEGIASCGRMQNYVDSDYPPLVQARDALTSTAALATAEDATRAAK